MRTRKRRERAHAGKTSFCSSPCGSAQRLRRPEFRRLASGWRHRWIGFALSTALLVTGGVAVTLLASSLESEAVRPPRFERTLAVAGFPWLPQPGPLREPVIPPSLPTAAGATPATAPATAPTQPTSDARSASIRGLLAGRPLAPYAELMVAVSDEHGIDWRLLPVIAFVESGGGVHACGWNAWGYAACRAGFSSYEEGIRVVAALLASPPYSGLSTAGLLCMWVSGDGCNSQHAVDYAYRVAGVYSMLGGGFALPARIAAPAENGLVSTADSAVAAFTPPIEAAAGATPSPSPSPGPSPATTPMAIAPAAASTATPATRTPAARTPTPSTDTSGSASASRTPTPAIAATTALASPAPASSEQD